MVAIIWAVVAAILAILVVVVEQLLGFHEPTSSAVSPNILWFIIPPLVVVAAMVHNRQRSTEAITYGLALRVGLVTAAATSTILAATWAVITKVLVPDFAFLLTAQRHADVMSAGAAGNEAMAQAYAAAKLFTMPTIMIVGFVLPMVSGSIAAAVTAIGLRRVAAK